MWDGDDLSEDDEEESSEEESEGEGSGELGEEEEEDESNLSETEDAKEKCVLEGSSDEEEKDEDDESDDEINNKSYLPYRDKEEIKEEKEGQKKSAHQFTVYQKTNVSHHLRNIIIQLVFKSSYSLKLLLCLPTLQCIFSIMILRWNISVI